MTTNSAPHDGSIHSYACQLQFIDIAIRDKLAQMMNDNTLHLVWDKLKTPAAQGLLKSIMDSPRKPLSHTVRILLAAALDIECPLQVPRTLANMREYPL